MQNIIFYYWKNLKIPKVPSSVIYNDKNITDLFTFSLEVSFGDGPVHARHVHQTFVVRVEPNLVYVVPRPLPVDEWGKLLFRGGLLKFSDSAYNL